MANGGFTRNIRTNRWVTAAAEAPACSAIRTAGRTNRPRRPVASRHRGPEAGPAASKFRGGHAYVSGMHNVSADRTRQAAGGSASSGKRRQGPARTRLAEARRRGKISLQLSFSKERINQARPCLLCFKLAGTPQGRPRRHRRSKMPAKFKEIERNRGVDSLKPGPGWIMVPAKASPILSA